VVVVKTDVSKEEDCKHLIEETVKHFNGIDILILNAAKSEVTLFQNLKPTPFATIKSMMKANFMQSVYLTHFSLPYLLSDSSTRSASGGEGKGHIVAVSSIAGLMGNYGSTAYASSKHAIHGFYACLRLELATSLDITVLPLPFVDTQTALKVTGAKSGLGISEKECAVRMVNQIRKRSRMPLLTWETFFGVQIFKVFPAFMDRLIFLAVPTFCAIVILCEVS